MKKKMLSFMVFLVFACAATDAYAQQINTGGGAGGGACTITGGRNKGKTGTYDGTGWCCTKTNGGGDCTECQRADGSNYCKSGLTKAIVPSFALTGTWVLTTATGQPARKSSITIAAGTAGTVNTFSATDPVSGGKTSGILIDKSTIRITYPGTKTALFGTLTSANRIDWSDGSFSTRK